MNFDLSDPRLTAYVVGELDDAERAEVERLLAESPEARRAVAELRDTVALVRDELAREPLPQPLPSAPLPDALSPPTLNPQTVIPHAMGQGHAARIVAWLAFGGVAAALAVALLLPAVQRAREAGRPSMARRDASTSSPASAPTSADVVDFTDTPVKQHSRGDVNGDSLQGAAGKDGRAVGSGASPRSDDAALLSTVEAKNKLRLPVERSKTHAGRISPSRALGEKGASGGQPSKTRDESRRDLADDLSSRTDKKKVAAEAQRAQSPAGPIVGKPLFQSAAETSPAQRAADSAPLASTAPNEPAAEGDLAARLEVVKEVEEQLRQVPQLQESLFNTEGYDHVEDNPFRQVSDDPRSTFSIDVDTASYANVRRFMTQNRVLPPRSAVRIEELVNYFRYDYPQPEGKVPFSVHTEVAGCPWNAEHRLVKVGLKGREVAKAARPKSNLVFLIDVSGSMNEPNKLPLVKAAMKLLVGQLTENDKVALVVYAGSSGLVLPSTGGDKQAVLLEALDRLEAGGSTNGGQGIQLAYYTALQNFVPGGANRVILATDGDFNVGVTDRGELVKLIEQHARSGVFLTTLGFGMGNLKDNTLEQLADKGNGKYAYIDDLREAQKELVEELSGTLVTIAKDVKLQIEFNPATVAAFRLIGYENRVLQHEDFNDDSKDAGEIGAGHTVTALYEIVPVGQAPKVGTTPQTEPLKYQQKSVLTERAASGELLTLSLRYKEPEAQTSQKLEFTAKDAGNRYAQASADFKFASAVALFGMLLRESPHKGSGTWDGVIELAQEGRGSDHDGRRAELIELARQAKTLQRPHP